MSTRVLLALQGLLLFVFETVLDDSIRYFSAYGPADSPFRLSIAFIPLTLLLASYLKPERRTYLFLIFPFLFFKTWRLSLLLIPMLVLHHLTRFAPKSNLLTASLLAGTMILIFCSGILLPDSTGALKWLWIMIHVTWGIKMIAWIVTVRVYADRHYTLDQLINYFLNPAFFFFTNDLNVLTPRRFFSSIVTDATSAPSAIPILKQTFLGMFLLLLYGLVQRYYFMNLDEVGILSSWWFGGVASVLTAILFHAANVSLQVSLLNSSGHNLPIDMNRPWLAVSPGDYWRRMHFFVREYIFDIIVKPVLTNVLRHGFSANVGRFSVVTLLYLIFTGTQIGYQPYRQDRSITVWFIITAVFLAMIVLPELLGDDAKSKLFAKRPWLGRILTFAILIAGYSLIYRVRAGF
ncbi:MAG: hypothetical protein RBT63_04050 [Bdellovibrionales bacterium]|jgi:hypothetical protein|nr:hypothetical protein [Bdellovibrionales bacterium]